MKKKNILLIILCVFVVMLFAYYIKSYYDIETEDDLNEKTQNNLYQAFLKKDIDVINEILLGTKFIFDKKTYTYEECVKLNITKFLNDGSKYIDIKKINFSSSNMHHKRPLYFLVWNRNGIDGISGELWWEVEYRDGKLYSIKSDNNDLLFEYLFINNNKKNTIKAIIKE